MPLRSVGLCVLLVGLVIGIASPEAFAQSSASELRTSGRQIAAELAAQRSGGHVDAAAQLRVVDRLGQLALAYIDLSERAANAGTEAREREALRGAYEAVSGPLDDIYDQNSGAIDRMVKQVMDEDGDLEALYDTPPFKDAQTVASHALYFLNWLHFYGARLYDGAQRKQLLEKAQRGFSEFAVGDRHSELLVESLLGRGLCHLELGNTEFAVHDLRAVMDDPQASPERKAKARLALLDAYARGGNIIEVLKLSDQVLGSGGRAEDNLVRFIRTRALLEAAKKASGAEAARYRQQAMTSLDQLRRAGGGWEEKAAALAASSIDDPAQFAASANSPFAKWELAKMLVQKGDYKPATPLLEGFVSHPDDAMRSHEGEAHYFLGLARFQAGQYQDAADQLSAALKDPNAAYGADAAYLRFKAMEALVAKGGADLSAPYEQAIRAYVSRYPDHKSAFEAQFRLGELLQAQHKFADAIQAYAKVEGDAAFELRAQFATLQCDFELLQGLDTRTDGAQRAALITDIGAGLPRFARLASDYEKRGGKSEQVPLNQMHAKAAIMNAVYVTLQSEPNDQAILDSLAGFEKKYPEQQDLLPQVARLRMTAYLHLGRFQDADGETKTHGQLLLSTLGATAIEDLAVGYVREGAKRRARQGDAANQAAQQVALHLYELLVSDSEGNGKAKLTLARLYENTGDTQKATDLYDEILSGNENSLAAVRGLARLAESGQHLQQALGYWQRLTKAARAGDLPWYEGSYEVARLTAATGKKDAACDQLNQLKPAMPGLSDADLRKKLDELYQRVCG